VKTKRWIEEFKDGLRKRKDGLSRRKKEVGKYLEELK
jgi:hypothetical protein